jgi:hypothetical protein
MTRLIIFGAMGLAFVCILVGVWIDNRDEIARRGMKWWW